MSFVSKLVFIATASSIMAVTGSAVAADLSEQTAAAVTPNFSARITAAFAKDNIDGDALDVPEKGRASYYGEAAFAYRGFNGFGVQGEIAKTYYDGQPNNDNDWTEYSLMQTGHVFYEFSPEFLVGGFFGGGQHDADDSDGTQSFHYYGVETRFMYGDTAFFGQLGKLDGQDQFNESLTDAVFYRVGAKHFFTENISLLAAFSAADGRKTPGESNHVRGFEVEYEHKLDFVPNTSAFARYDHMRFEDENEDARLDRVLVGLKFRFDDGSLRSAHDNGVSLDTIDFARWQSYITNEIE